jgi:hypothetical protein
MESLKHTEKYKISEDDAWFLSGVYSSYPNRSITIFSPDGVAQMGIVPNQPTHHAIPPIKLHIKESFFSSYSRPDSR